jgi:hypothetical protein
VVAARNARGIFPSKLMIECELLSGLKLRHVQKPRADMVICRSGPNLNNEFFHSERFTGFPNPDLFDHCAHSGRRLHTPLGTDGASLQHDVHAAVANARSL